MSDIPNLEQRLREFAAAPDERDWHDVLRRAGERLPARPFTRRRLALALAVGGVVASLAGVAIWLATRAPARASGPTGAAGPTFGATGAEGATGPDDAGSPAGRNPWGENARKITLDELRAEAPYVPLPSSSLANDSNVGSVWVLDHTSDPSEMPAGEVVAAVYYPASGIELMWGSGVGSVSGNTDTASFPMIDGVPAFLCYHEAVNGQVDEQGSSCAQGPTGADGATGAGATGAEGSTGAAGPTGGEGSYLGPVLVVPFGPYFGMTLEGASASDLISVAKALSPSPADVSPASALPTAGLQPYADAGGGLLIDGVSYGSVDDAAGSLAFRPVAPSSLGKPSVILEGPPQALTSDRVLALRYDRPSRQPFWVLERPSLPTTASVLTQIASDCLREEGCAREVVSMVDLGGGVSALRVWTETGRIAWVEGGVYYEVVGDVTSFTGAEARAVENLTAFSGVGAELAVAKAVVAAASG